MTPRKTYSSTVALTMDTAHRDIDRRQADLTAPRFDAGLNDLSSSSAHHDSHPGHLRWTCGADDHQRGWPRGAHGRGWGISLVTPP